MVGVMEPPPLVVLTDTDESVCAMRRAGHRRQDLGRPQMRRQSDPDAKDIDVT
jgi:hypothetical protein